MIYLNYILLLIMTLLGSFASFFLKKSSSSNGVLSLLKNINLYVGAFLYLLSAIINIYILKYLPYSVVLPLTSITYLWTMIISLKLLNERITSKKILGVLCILMGAVLIIK